MMRPRTKSAISAGTRKIDKQRRRGHGEGLGVGERLEQPALLRFQGEDGQERHGDDEKAEEERGTHLDRGFDHDLGPRLAGRRPLEPLMRVLDHDDGGIHHRADGDGDAAEAHDVGAEPQGPHADIGDENAERQRDDGDERAARMQQEDDADERDNQALLDQRALQRVDGAVDESRTIVDRLDAHAFGQARRDLGDTPFHVVDDRERVLAGALKGDAADNLALAVHFGDAAALVGGELDARHVLEQHRNAALVLDDDLLEVGQVLDIAAAAHGELCLRHFEGAAADIHVAFLDDLANARERNAERLKPARVDDHAILLDEAADARDLGHARRVREPEAEIPILDGAQLGEASLRAPHHILIDPANPGGVGPKAWGHALRQPARGGTQIFEHARPRPIDIGSFLENHIDKRDAEIREAAHDARLGHGQHRRRERIGDLILDDLRRLPRKLGVNDDLRVGEVGNGVERHAVNRIDAEHGHEQRGEPDEKDIAGGPADDRGDHFGSPWLKA